MRFSFQLFKSHFQLDDMKREKPRINGWIPYIFMWNNDQYYYTLSDISFEMSDSDCCLWQKIVVTCWHNHWVQKFYNIFLGFLIKISLLKFLSPLLHIISSCQYSLFSSEMPCSDMKLKFHSQAYLHFVCVCQPFLPSFYFNELPSDLWIIMGSKNACVIIYSCFEYVSSNDAGMTLFQLQHDRFSQGISTMELLI